jgi:hypothetical protein
MLKPCLLDPQLPTTDSVEGCPIFSLIVLPLLCFLDPRHPTIPSDEGRTVGKCLSFVKPTSSEKVVRKQLLLQSVQAIEIYQAVSFKRVKTTATRDRTGGRQVTENNLNAFSVLPCVGGRKIKMP